MSMHTDQTGWLGNEDSREKHGGHLPSDRIVMGGGIDFPLELVYNKVFITGKTGSGKSWTAAVLMEEFERLGLQFVCWDALDAHGYMEQLPNVERISPDEDQTIDMPAFVKRLKRTNKSVVINLMGMSLARQQQLIGDYCAALLEADFLDERGNRRSLMTIIEECQDYVPQQGRPLSFEPIVRLCKLGRALGFGVTMISQRPAAVNKEALSQASVYLIHNVIQFRDLKALEEQMGFGNDRGMIRRITGGIASAKSGECVAFSPDFFRDQGYIVIGKIRGDRRVEHKGINIEVRQMDTTQTTPQEPHITPGVGDLMGDTPAPPMAFDASGLDGLRDSGFGSEDTTFDSLEASGFATTYSDENIFRPLQPIVEYDPAPPGPSPDSISYAEDYGSSRSRDGLGPVVGVTVMVLIAGGLYVLTKPSTI